MTISILFLTHLLSALYMTGLIWFVQIVHYPLFSAVPKDGFVAYEKMNLFRTTFVVLPPMLLEISSGALLYFSLHEFAINDLSQNLFYFASFALLSIWASTFFIQVPLHSTLESGHNQTAIRRLVRSNWIRTIAWSLRSIILLCILFIWKFES